MDWEDPKSVMKALVLLYSLQTSEEKEIQATVMDNGVGFNAVDAPILTSIAQQFLRTNAISEKQFRLSRAKLSKYENQITTMESMYDIDFPEEFEIYESKTESNFDGIISIVGDRILFKPNIYPSKDAMSAGFTWAKDGSGVWEAPADPLRLERIQGIFPNHILDDSVEEWQKSLDELPELSDEVIQSDLMTFQKEAVSFMQRTNKGLLGLAPGLGKTPISIMGVHEHGGRTLVICPFSLLFHWRREIKKWVDEDSAIWHGFIGSNQAKWVITNYETALGYMVTFDLKTYKKNGKPKKRRTKWRPTQSFPFDNVIVDESVLIKNRYAQRSKAVYTIANKLKDVKRVYLLSGSPTTKYLDDMWHQFHTLDRTRFNSYWDFAAEYCILEDTPWGTKIKRNKTDGAARIKYHCRDIYFARTQDQVLDLPDWIFDVYTVPMTPQQSSLYNQMQDEFVAELPDGDKVVAPNILSQMTRLLQFASNPILVGGPDLSPKQSTAIDLLEFESLPAILWINYIKTAGTLLEKLEKKGYSVGLLTGETSNAMRDKIVQDFQNGKIDVIIAHPGVGKFGLTLTAAKTVIYVERSYNGDDYYQSLHRVRRIGTKHSPHVILLLSSILERLKDEVKEKPTIDHVVHKSLGTKREVSIEITTGLIREVLYG